MVTTRQQAEARPIEDTANQNRGQQQATDGRQPGQGSNLVNQTGGAGNQQEAPMNVSTVGKMADMIGVFDGQHPLPSTWLQKFKQVAKAYTWADEKKAQQFPLFLKDSAHQWHGALSEAVQKDIKQLEQAFKDRYINVRRHSVVSQLHARRLKPGETVDDFIDNIRHMGSQVGKTDQDIVDLIMNGLPGRLKSFVMGKEPQTLDDVIAACRLGQSCQLEDVEQDSSAKLDRVTSAVAELSTKFEQLMSLQQSSEVNSASASSSAPGWNNQGYPLTHQTVHSGRAQWTPTRRQGHRIHQFQHQQNVPGQPCVSGVNPSVCVSLPGYNQRQNVYCFVCGKPGHRARECYHKGKVCHKCGKQGHLAAVCSTNMPGHNNPQ